MYAYYSRLKSRLRDGFAPFQSPLLMDDNDKGELEFHSFFFAF